MKFSGGKAAREETAEAPSRLFREGISEPFTRGSLLSRGGRAKSSQAGAAEAKQPVFQQHEERPYFLPSADASCFP